MSIYDDAMPELQPGNTAEIVESGHVFHVTATRLDGFHTGRRRYMVECLTCKATIHEATTGPRERIGQHVEEVARTLTSAITAARARTWLSTEPEPSLVDQLRAALREACRLARTYHAAAYGGDGPPEETAAIAELEKLLDGS